MYVLLFALLFGGGALLVRRGIATGHPMRMWGGIGLLVGGSALVALMALWFDMLWFDAVGYIDRFWTFFRARLGIGALGFVGAGLIGYALARGTGKHLKKTLAFFSACAGGIWGFAAWQRVLMYWHGVDTNISDPLLGLDVSFYLFTLPLLDSLFWPLLFITVLCLLAVLLLREVDGVIDASHHFLVPHPRLLIPRASLALAFVLAYAQLLGVYHLLYSELGVVMGPGWTDVHVRLPALLLMGIVLIVAAILPLSARFREFMRRRVARFRIPLPDNLVATLGAWAVIGVSWVFLVLALPALVQWLVVKPNEITFETPYIAHNIEFTKAAFKLDRIEERQFPASPELTRQALDSNRNLLAEVRLWDLQALDAVYKQFQEIRLYYEFVDVDIDRYQIGDRYRQVMVAARELAQQNLPKQSQTFVNKRFKYTHGYGHTLAPVSDFTPQGLPNLLVKNIPPVASHEALHVDRPEIYYGELTHEAVVVNTKEPEFDYPSGETNVYTRYQGNGGVVLSNWWRRFVFGWRFDGTVFVLSSYPTEESRIMYYRRIQERVGRLAPFLQFDEDPYIVAVNGRLKWIVDGYTSSSYYPYSQPFDSRESLEYARDAHMAGGDQTVRALNGKNYVRNSVKAVVDAYNGDVQLYVFEAEDPIIQTWQNILPTAFLPRAEMPAELQAHVRYPQDLLLAQGLIFTRYHMSDPEVFYNQEDLWVRATEKHYHQVKPVEPYYVMWELPGSDKAEFVLMLPFTPKNRQVLIGWIAALSDGDNYGRFIAYKFPKERRVLGPQQVETKIDQDSFLSGQLTLWDQQGSEVIRGNVLAIPLDDTLLYVEPIYLRAETAAYPELRLVAVMHGDTLSYAETFAEALAGLFDKQVGAKVSVDTSGGLAAAAQQAFDAYLLAQGEGRFEDAAAALRRLSELLRALNQTDSAQQNAKP